jgi:hypothetical protein
VQLLGHVGRFAVIHESRFVPPAPGIHSVITAQIKQICLIAFIVDLASPLSLVLRNDLSKILKAENVIFSASLKRALLSTTTTYLVNVVSLLERAHIEKSPPTLWHPRLGHQQMIMTTLANIIIPTSLINRGTVRWVCAAST